MYSSRLSALQVEDGVVKLLDGILDSHKNNLSFKDVRELESVSQIISHSKTKSTLKHYMASITAFKLTSSRISNPFAGVT